MLFVFNLQISYTLTYFLSILLYSTTNFQICHSWGLTGQLAHLPGVCMRTVMEWTCLFRWWRKGHVSSLLSEQASFHTRHQSKVCIPQCCSLLPPQSPYTPDSLYESLIRLNSWVWWSTSCNMYLAGCEVQVPLGHGRWEKHFREMYAECERLAR